MQLIDIVYYSCSESGQEQADVISKSLAAGTVIDDKYEITAVLDQGGMGTIYSATQIGLNRYVIIKTLQIERSGQDGALMRFEREAKLLGSIQHEHLVQVFSSGVINNRLPYIAMEFIDGKTLTQEISDTGRLSWRRTCEIGKQICQAMTHAHAQGIVHRDLKPANVLLLDKPHPDFVKVIDFGLGSFFNQSGQQTITETGALVGSPQYMSPEMCSGLKSDWRSDIYSLGCLLYECLVGTPPFTSDNPVGLLYQHKNELPNKPSRHLIAESVPPELDAVILKALEKQPEKRYQSMEEFGISLQALLDDTTLSFDLSEISAAPDRVRSAPKLNRATTLALVLFGIALLSLPVLLKLKSINTKNTRIESRDQFATELLNQAAKTRDEALKAERTGTRRKALDLADKSMRILIKELVTARDATKMFAKEVEVIQGYKNIASLLIKPSNEKQLEAMVKAKDLENHAGNYHNEAMLALFAMRVFKEDRSWLYTDAACKAIDAFGRAKEFHLAEQTAEEALLQIKKFTNDEHSILTSKVNLSRALVYIEQGRMNEAIKTAEAERTGIRDSYDSQVKADLHLRIAGIYERTGKLLDAEREYTLGLPNMTIEDGNFSTAWAGLANVFEKQNKIEDAIKAHQQLRIHSLSHNDIHQMAKAEANIERLSR